METQAFFENIQAQIQTRLLAAETEIDLQLYTTIKFYLCLFDCKRQLSCPEKSWQVNKVKSNILVKTNKKNISKIIGNKKSNSNYMKNELNVILKTKEEIIEWYTKKK